MFEQTFKNIDDVLWKEAGCTTELDYTEQTSWILFLKYLDDLETERSNIAQLEGKKHSAIIEGDYRWAKWAAPIACKQPNSATARPGCPWNCATLTPCAGAGAPTAALGPW